MAESRKKQLKSDIKQGHESYRANKKRNKFKIPESNEKILQFSNID